MGFPLLTIEQAQMLIKNLYADLLDNPLPDVVYLQCHDEKGDSRTHHAASLHVAVFGDASMRRLYKECIHAITPHGKGLGVGASVRTLPGAGKERLSERSEF